MAVNGGGPIQVRVEGDGIVTQQRRFEPDWQQFVDLEDLAVTRRDSARMPLDTSGSSAVSQVIRGTEVRDAMGTRRPLLYLRAGTRAELVMPDETVRPAPSLSVHISEFTAGDRASRAMPGNLPANTALTYASEVFAEEAQAAGAKHVRLSVPARYYIEPTVAVPVGSAVPLGFYERDEDVWRAEASGVALRILSVAGGVATIDSDGDGNADSAATLAALSLDADEQRTLAREYPAGVTLWRMLLPHFSMPDFNFARWFAGLFRTPPERPTPIEPSECRSTQRGSIVYCESQVLAERVGVAGTGLFLHHQSDRVPGFLRAYSLDIPLTGPSVDPTLRKVLLEVTIAGEVLRQTFMPTPNQTTTFVWNGRDVYDREVQGTQRAIVRVGYVYEAVVSTQTTAQREMDFALNTGERAGFGPMAPVRVTPGRADDELIVWRRWEQILGVWDVRHEGLGGWSLSAQHRYDPVSQSVLHGDGSIRSAQAIGPTLRTVAGSGRSPTPGESPRENVRATTVDFNSIQALALAPDGSVLISDGTRVRRVSRDGVSQTLAGDGTRGSMGDNGPALRATLFDVRAISVLRDGSVLLVEAQRVRRVRPDGVIVPFAGSGVRGDSGDGGPALLAQFTDLRAVVQAPDGSVLLADQGANRVRRVSTRGDISTVFGDGRPFDPSYDDLAVRSRAWEPGSLAVTPEGVLYVAIRSRIVRIDPDGNVRHVMGLRPGATPSGDGGLAADYPLRTAVPQIALARDGTLFVSDPSSVLAVREGLAYVLTRVDAATGRTTPEGANAKGASVYDSNALLAHPDGSLWVAEGGAFRVRAITAAMPGLPVGEVIVPSAGGGVIDVFGSTGRHERVLDSRTGRVLQRFGYTARGHLDRVEDDSANVLRIERNAQGIATAIIAPTGQRTTLTINAQGDLVQVRDPVARTWGFTYVGTGGLLQSFVDPRSGMHTFAYNPQGLLLRDTGPDGASVSLTRTELPTGFEVTMQPALGNPTRYRMLLSASGTLEHQTVRSDGLTAITRMPRDGTTTTTTPEGLVMTQRARPDPRWGMRVALAESLSIATPSGVRMEASQERTVALRDPNDVTSVTGMTDTNIVNGRRSERSWDSATRTWTLRSAAGRTTTMVEDAMGRLVEARMAGFETIRWVYDARGRIDSVTQGARTQRVSYDARGWATSNTDALMRMHRAVVDDVGRPLSVTSSDGRTASLSWDSHDNVTSVTPPGAMAHRFAYTAQDLTESASPPVADDGDPTVRAQWDAMQRPTTVTLAGGRNAAISYDLAGRIATVTTAEGAYRYDYSATTGQLTSVSNPAGPSLAMRYDGALATEIQWSGDVAGSVSRAYDNDFRVSRERVNGANDLAYRYDADGLVTSAGPVTLTRGASSGLTDRVSVANSVTDVVHDGYGSVTSAVTSLGAASVFEERLTYDALGRIVSKIERVEGRESTLSYAFDGADRLREVRRDGVVSETYAYDANGNRTSATVDGVTRAGVADSQDRLRTYGEFAYTYNREGQWTERRDTRSGQSTRYRYDQGGALREVTLANGQRIDYAIDAAGRRVGKRVGGVWRSRWLYRDGLRPIAELDAAGAVQSVFVYASRANVPDAIVRGGRVFRVVCDHVGSVRSVVDASTGAVVQRLRYDAYGRVLEDSAPGWQPFGFAGGLYDSDTGLVRFGARDYDAVSGRWTTRDPSGLSGGLNVYGYASGDPVNLVDVDGNNPILVWLAEIAAGAIWGALGEIAVQLYFNGPRCIEWSHVWSAAKTGALFGALSGLFAAWNAPWFCLSGCFVAGTLVDTDRGKRPIETVALGDRIGPESAECATVSTDDWVEIALQIRSAEVHLLRPRAWAERVGAREGASIELDLTELNIEGPAQVTHVRPPCTLAGGREGFLVRSSRPLSRS
ncbi:MAG: RHS repeat-associated core domain-containing protein [Deltaproteobacteria bacterium]|nr:RHS repeat-associated core domain-containing protein [Deltaproteobacteria bacterium]